MVQKFVWIEFVRRFHKSLAQIQKTHLWFQFSPFDFVFGSFREYFVCLKRTKYRISNWTLLGQSRLSSRDSQIVYSVFVCVFFVLYKNVDSICLGIFFIAQGIASHFSFYQIRIYSKSKICSKLFCAKQKLTLFYRNCGFCRGTGQLKLWLTNCVLNRTIIFP